MALGFEEVLDINNHMDEQVENGTVKKQLSKGRECEPDMTEEDNKNNFICQDLKILSDSQDDRMKY